MTPPDFRFLSPLLAKSLRGMKGQEYSIGEAVLTGIVAHSDNTVGVGVIAGTVPADAREIIGCYSLEYLREAVSLADRIGVKDVVLAAYGDQVPQQALLLMIDTRGDRFVAVASKSLAMNYPAKSDEEDDE
ncbi:MAG: hypothetical protein WC343_11325 [Bacilli bacterium]|jgi:hypothetical protein